MADLGSLHFQIHLQDMTDADADKIKKKLENLSVSLKIDGNNITVANTDAIKKQIEAAVKSVSIPSVSVDANAVKQQVDTAFKTATPQVSVTLLKGNLDKDIQTYLSSKTYDIKISISSQQAQSQIKNLGSVTITAKLKLDKKAAIDALKKSLQNSSVPIGVRMKSAKDLANDIRTKMQNTPIKVNIDANKNILTSNIKQALKNQTFKADLKLNIQKVDVQQAIRDAFAKAGLAYNTTASNVRAALINTRQQKADAYVDAQKALADLRRAQMASAQAAAQHKNAMQGVNDVASKQKSLMTQLAQKIADLYSVVRIGDFVANMIRIGGEFEQQKVALGTIVGDAGKAGALFERIKGLAVESPYKFGDLAAYSKQLAAFGVEYNELYDTLKRFGDISAGLGVDMQRIILAFGQVKSAEFLKGTELRQFTEAGIPLVSELARRYTELEGAAVSVGDVFDRISRKEVPFADVRAVLWDLTNEGGRFFEMQAVLTDTLKGKLDKLVDSYEIFLSEIGNSNRNILGGALDLLAEILKHWKDIEKWVVAVSVAYGAYRAAILSVAAAQKVAIKVETLQKAISSMMFLGKATNGVSAAFSLLGKTMLSNPIGAIAGAMGAMVGIVYMLRYKVEDVTSSIDKMNASIQESVDVSNAHAQKANDLATIIKNEKYSIDARRKAYEQLEGIYPALFENMDFEKTALMDELELREKIAAASKEETKAKLKESLAEAKAGLAEAIRVRDTQRGSYDRYGNFSDSKTQQDKKREQANVDKWEQQVAEIELQIESLDHKIAEESARKSERWYKDTEAYVTSLGEKFKDLMPKDDEDRDNYFGRIGNAVSSLKNKIGELNPELESAKELLDGENGLNAEYKVTKHIYTKILGGKDEETENRLKEVLTNNEKDAKEAAKRLVQAYAEALKTEISKVGSQWGLFKDLLEATGNEKVSMNLAFGGQISFKSQLEQLEKMIDNEIKKNNLGISVSDLLNMSEEDIASKINSGSWGEDMVKNLQSLTDAYKSENEKVKEESIKNFIEIVKNSNDFAQQIENIERKLQKDLADLRSNASKGGISEDDLVRRGNELKKAAEEDKSKVRFEEFKKSSDWVKVFDDLGRVSDSTLDNMISKVEEFARQAGASEEVTKQLVEAMSKLRNETIERNPFEGFESAWKRLKYFKGLSSKVGEYDEHGKLITQQMVDDGIAEANDDLEKSALAVADKFQATANAADLLGGLFENLGLELGGLGDILGGTASGAQAGAGIASAFGIGGPWGAIAGAAVGMLSSVFAAHDKALQKEIEASQSREKLIKSVASNLENALNNKLGGIFTISLDAASKKQMETLMTLTKDYEGRRKKKELVYSDATRDMAQEALNDDSYYKAQKALLMAQIDELKNQKKAEEDKKNEDQVKIADYELAIAEMEGELEMFAQDMMNAIYGIDFKDWARQFTDAIIGAWASGEDAAEAYKNTVSDVMRNVAASVIQQGIIGKWLEENMSHVLELFSKNDGKITSDVYSAMADLAAGVGGKIEETESFLEEWEKLLNEKDYSIKDLESASGGSLSKGIQSVTEDTANLLGSYLNSIRQSVHVKQQFIEKLVSEDIPKINYLAEAQLRELSQIQANTARNVVLVGEIRDLMNRVVDKGSNKLKV